MKMRQCRLLQDDPPDVRVTVGWIDSRVAHRRNLLRIPELGPGWWKIAAVGDVERDSADLHHDWKVGGL